MPPGGAVFKNKRKSEAKSPIMQPGQRQAKNRVFWSPFS